MLRYSGGEARALETGAIGGLDQVKSCMGAHYTSIIIVLEEGDAT